MSAQRSHNASLTDKNMRIEKIRRQDLDDLQKLFSTAFSDEIPLLQLEQRIRRIRQFYHLVLPLSYFSLWAQNLFNVYICRIAGEIAGFIQLSQVNKQQLHLDYIAVAPHYRVKGIGTQMLHYLCKHVADRHRYDLILEVNTANPAHQLYQRFGFTEKIRILSYEKKMPHPPSASSPTVNLSGLRERKDTDWRQLYTLYLRCISEELRQVVRREISEFHPSLFTRVLEWAKNHLMHNRHRHYVLEKANRIVGLLDIYYYPKTRAYSLSMMLDHGHEQLRAAWIRQALDLLIYHPDTVIYTTIYNDNPRKSEALQNHGFQVKEAYRLMFRPPQPEILNRQDAKGIRIRTQRSQETKEFDITASYHPLPAAWPVGHKLHKGHI